MRFWGTADTGEGASIIREDRGKSLLEFPSDYVVIDIETTGLDPWEHKVIEVAAARVRGREVVGSFERLIDPQVTISDEITGITGIDQSMVSGKPTFSEIMDELKGFLGTDVLVGHNVGFDVAFLYEKYYELTGVGITNKIVDTLRWSRHLFPDQDSHRLSDLCDRLTIKNPGAHRAMNDVLTTQRVYEALRQEELARSGEDDADQMSLF